MSLTGDTKITQGCQPVLESEWARSSLNCCRSAIQLRAPADRCNSEILNLHDYLMISPRYARRWQRRRRRWRRLSFAKQQQQKRRRAFHMGLNRKNNFCTKRVQIKCQKLQINLSLASLVYDAEHPFLSTARDVMGRARIPWMFFKSFDFSLYTVYDNHKSLKLIVVSLNYTVCTVNYIGNILI